MPTNYQHSKHVMDGADDVTCLPKQNSWCPHL